MCESGPKLNFYVFLTSVFRRCSAQSFCSFNESRILIDDDTEDEVDRSSSTIFVLDDCDRHQTNAILSSHKYKFLSDDFKKSSSFPDRLGQTERICGQTVSEHPDELTEMKIANMKVTGRDEIEYRILLTFIFLLQVGVIVIGFGLLCYFYMKK